MNNLQKPQRNGTSPKTPTASLEGRQKDILAILEKTQGLQRAEPYKFDSDNYQQHENTTFKNEENTD